MKMNWEDRMKVENEIVSVSQACAMKCSFEMVRYPFYVVQSAEKPQSIGNDKF